MGDPICEIIDIPSARRATAIDIVADGSRPRELRHYGDAHGWIPSARSSMSERQLLQPFAVLTVPLPWRQSALVRRGVNVKANA
ncbi:hypothetical protein AB1N83_014173 [Pleurotus pulmonarius]